MGVKVLKKGLIQVYTGNGKGKTTAAVGQAIRALGDGLKVCHISFFKDPKRWRSGEFGILKKSGADVFHFALEHPHFHKKVNRQKIRMECMKGLRFFEGICSGRIPATNTLADKYATDLCDKSHRYKKKKYDLVILDEIVVAVRDGFLEENTLLKLLHKKPAKMEVVLTGRGAKKLLINSADLVTEMKKLKHPYDKGVKGRKGIEY